MLSSHAKRLIFFGACAVIAMAVIALRRKSEEPISAGKSLRNSFHELPTTKVGPSNSVMTIQAAKLYGVFGGTYGSQRVQPSEATAAIREIGEGALPFLRRKWSSPSLPFRRQIDRPGFARSLEHGLFTNREAEREQAVTGLLVLPLLPQSAIDRLNKLRRTSNLAIAASAGFIVAAQTDKIFRQN